jgi:hypothetical protein
MRRLAQARNPSGRNARLEMDSGLALRAPRNDGVCMNPQRTDLDECSVNPRRRSARTMDRTRAILLVAAAIIGSYFISVYAGCAMDDTCQIILCGHEACGVTRHADGSPRQSLWLHIHRDELNRIGR